jgi:hypothetical protein
MPVIPIAIAAGLGLAYYRVKGHKKMTPERKKIFEAALKTIKDPVKLNALADSFQKEGLRAEAGELRKRAKVLALPPEKKQEYRQIYKQGLSASDPDKVNNLARAFHEKGLYGSAKNLRDYALGLVKPGSTTTSNVPKFAPNVPLEGA